LNDNFTYLGTVLTYRDCVEEGSYEFIKKSATGPFDRGDPESTHNLQRVKLKITKGKENEPQKGDKNEGCDSTTWE